MGGTPALTQGLPSSNYLNGVIPSATISVYLTGTQTLATIYKDGNNTPLGNPFTSNAVNSTNPGGYIFYAATGQPLDVVASGGIFPNVYSSPIALYKDIFPGFGGGGGGCAVGNCVLISPTATQGVTQPASTSFYLQSYDPQNTIPGGATIQGFPLQSNLDFSGYQVNQGSGLQGTPGGFKLTTNYYGLTENTQNTFGGVPMVGGYGAYLDGIMDNINRYNSGQTFGTYNTINCYGTGDCMMHFDTVSADGGINRIDDEGVHWADSLVTEDPNVFTGTVTGTPATGATTIATNCSIGCKTQGADRLLIDTTASKDITGTFNQGSFTDTVNQVPFAISDPNASYPVSTIFALCYSGSDNGAGGTAGCPTNGTAPSGYIPPQSTSPTQQSPAASIATTILPSYPGQPSYFCTPTTIQTTTPGAACYLPASGVVCLSDAQEYETANYTYSGGTMTLLNLQSSHLNGMTAAVGGLCGYAVEASNSIYSGGGTSGVQSQVFPIEGSPNATTILDITQRTNEGYGSVAIGDSENDWGFSTSASGFSSSGALVNINVNAPSSAPGVPTGAVTGCLNDLNNLSVTITTANSTYNGTYPLTQTGCTSFTYQPSTAVSGTQPTTGTVAFTNMQYTLFPAARAISVSDSYIGTKCTTTTNCINGNFYLMPNTVAWASGDTVREPHYQQMMITGEGNPRVVARWMREQYLGANQAGTTYNGLMTGFQGGANYNNSTPSTQYVEHGGTYKPPEYAVKAAGVFAYDLDAGNAPETSLLEVENWKPDIGASSPNSDFGIVSISAQLPGAFPGFSSDFCRYIPEYNLANRGQALSSGEFYCGQEAIGNPVNHNSVTTWEYGNGILDWNLSSPEITSNDVTVQPLSNAQTLYVNTVGTAGSTTYNYELVAHDLNGGVTVPVGPQLVNTGNATLSTTNYNQLCAPRSPGVESFDFLKEVSGVYQSLAVNVAVGNGASYSQVPNYTCVNDQGQATSAYTMPIVNTTGGLKAATMIATTSVTTPTVDATVSVTTPVVKGSDAATFAAGGGAGTSPTAPACFTGYTCTASSGTVSITTGTSPNNTGALITVSFTALPAAYANCVVSGFGVPAGATVLPYIGGTNATSFSIWTGNTPAASTPYEFSYVCQQ